MESMDFADKQLAFYDFEVFEQDWLVVIKTSAGVTYKIHNNIEELKEVAKNISCWVGFNNYFYDDYILAALLLNTKNIKETSDYIIYGEKLKKLRMLVNKFQTLDCMQELNPNNSVSLKEVEANLLENIHETPIDFKIRRKLTEDEVEEVFKYCENDVIATSKLFEIRKDYFDSKMDIVRQFGLNKEDVRLTRAALAAKVLRCRKKRLPNDEYNFRYVPGLDLNKIPQEIVTFYENIRNDFLDGTDPEELKTRGLSLKVAGVDHDYKFGGLHGVINNLLYEGPILCVDVGSYYPSLMINFDFISRASESPELYKNLYTKRMEYKAKKDPKQQIYKILLNATFGASKFKGNDLYDPVQVNNICINGQLLLTDLIMDLKDLTVVIQSNTDGIYFAYDPKDLNEIIRICKEWEQRYNLTLDYKYANKIIQRDVNSYAIRFEDGKVKAKGRFKYFKGGEFDRNNLAIIDKAMTDYYINDIPISETLMNEYRNNNMSLFQQIAKMGKTYSQIKHVVNNEYQDVQKINRIFATHDKKYGGIFKIKKDEETGTESYQKIANASDNVIIHNEDLATFDKGKLDLKYYKALIEKNMFKERRASNCMELETIKKQPIITGKELNKLTEKMKKEENQMKLFQK